jgi:hypothetical protein
MCIEICFAATSSFFSALASISGLPEISAPTAGHGYGL